MNGPCAFVAQRWTEIDSKKVPVLSAVQIDSSAALPKKPKKARLKKKPTSVVSDSDIDKRLYKPI